MSTNQGQSWTLMTGGVGNPLIIDTTTGKNVNPASRTARPPTAPRADRPGRPRPDRQRRAGPDLRGLALRGRRHPAGGFDGLFVTKDFGENWTQVQHRTTLPPARRNYNQAVARSTTRPSSTPPRHPNYADHRRYSRATWTSP